MKKIPIGVSQCLLGEAVRYDGDHKRNDHLIALQDIFDYRGICPEVAAGLGVPRDPIRLIKTGGQIQAVQYTATPRDVTQELAEQAALVAQQYPDICGYVFMQNSPSCGLFSVKQFNAHAVLTATKGRGIYAARLAQLMPLLPMEEAGRLAQQYIYENFLLRVMTLRDWQCNIKSDAGVEELRTFYRPYRYQAMAQHLPLHIELEHLLASNVVPDITQLQSRFIARLMLALNHMPTRAGNVRTLRHLRDRIRGYLNRVEGINLSRAIEAYQSKQSPFSVPLAQVRQALSRYDLMPEEAGSFWCGAVRYSELKRATFIAC
jgi:uncharacterized protein YbbK (DUF523 family)/uncharacterized protein YbgA (DUF1722 family)